MAEPRQFLAVGFRTVVTTLGSFALWTLWLGLLLLIFAQLYIATTSELALPAFVVRRIEARLAESGLQATFARTSFDPAGRLLVENLRFSPVGYGEPVLQARAVYVRLNPWMLAVGQVEPREIRIMGASAAVPTIVSGTGQPETLVRDFEATLVPGAHEIAFEQLTARVAGVTVTAHGTLPLPRRRAGAKPLGAAVFNERFPAYCRQALAFAVKLRALDTPTLHLEFSPAESGNAQIHLTAAARAVTLTAPVAAEAGDVHVETHVLVLDGTPNLTRLDASAAELRLPFAGGIVANGIRATGYGRLEGFTPVAELRSVELAVDALTALGGNIRGLSAELLPRPLPRVDATIAAAVEGSPLLLRAEADVQARSGTLRFSGAVPPGLLTILSERFKTDVRRFFDFDAIDCPEGVAHFAAGAKLIDAQARLTLRQIRAHGVTFDEGRAWITFDGHRIYAPEAWARIGGNFAYGSYEHLLPDHTYRFLLDGQLRPMDISGWFREWWPNFFRTLEFPAAPPQASVEVSGRWRVPARTSVFVYADAARPVIRGAALDHVHTRLFIRPGFFEGLELRAQQARGNVRGTFTFVTDPATKQWRAFDVDGESSLAFPVVRQLLGPPAEKLLAPYEVSAAPELRFRGHFDGPALATRHLDFALDAATAGDFRLFHFPVQDAAFSVHLHDTGIELPTIAARFGGGTVRGQAKIWGEAEARQLAFDLALSDASLGQAVAAFADFRAKQRGTPPTPPGKFVQEKANVRVDIAASAQGRLTDLLSYHGAGNAVLSGAELGEVPLFGALSDLLKFTALRFTSARSTFKIEGARLVFPDVAVRGANSAIDAHGVYSLDRHELDFNAKIFPFQESGNLIKSVVGAVLTPLSSVFEVKLAGSLEKPAWGLALGPGNLLRPHAADAKDATAGDAPSPGSTVPADSPPPPGTAAEPPPPAKP